MRGFTRTTARLALATAAALSVFALTLSSSATASSEEAKLVYNTQMSLTGNCAISEEDPIADPGCPGGSHPAKPFSDPAGVATDPHGDIYVASGAKASLKSVGEQELVEGRIDVFNPQGEYLTEITDEYGPLNIAVDSKGDIYVVNEFGRAFRDSFGSQAERALQLYVPKSYPPAAGTEYKGPVVVEKNNKDDAEVGAVAVDPSNDHLYATLTFHGIVEYGSAAEELPATEWTPRRENLDESVAAAGGAVVGGIAVYGHNHDIYAGGYTGAFGIGPQDAFVIDGSTGALKCEIDGSETPTGAFSTGVGNLGVGVDQANGNLLVPDLSKNHVIDEFKVEAGGCKYIGQLPIDPPNLTNSERWSSVAVDATCTKSEGGFCDPEYDSPNEGFVYVGSGIREGSSHLFAYAPKLGGPPEVEGQEAAEVTETEAVFRATLNAHDLDTHYWFEYVTQEAFAAHGYEGATRAPASPADAGSGASSAPVSVRVSGLQPGVSYRFRLAASNCEDPEAVEGECLTYGEGAPGGEGRDASFTTYRVVLTGLPDGRGYELVTPPDTGGYTPTMSQLGYGYETTQGSQFASADGNGLVFGIGGGSLTGYPGNGRRDTFEAQRLSNGEWRSTFDGVTGAQSENPSPGLFSEDHAVSTWFFAVPNDPYTGAYHLRRAARSVDPACDGEPGGTLELVGCGSLGTYPYAPVRWMSPDTAHIVFETTGGPGKSEVIRALEPGAPAGKSAIYDRTSDGVTHLVSLLPGDVPLTEDANFVGASKDSTAVAFQIGALVKTLYVHLDDERTVELAQTSFQDPARFAGLSLHGDRALYLVPNAAKPAFEGSHLTGGTAVPQGEIYLCEIRTAPCAGESAQPPVPIGSGDESVIVDVSVDGSHVFFVSPKVLDSKHAGREGAENLYVWDGTGIRLVADVSKLDVIGTEGPRNGVPVDSLGRWVGGVVGPAGEVRGPGAKASRATADGSIFVFESHSNLTGYDSAGHVEIYRYDSNAQAGQRLSCVSCSPTGAQASADSQLQGDAPEVLSFLPPVDDLADMANLSTNGQRVFFQTSERLVSGDIDNNIDVYEWEVAGEGSCTTEAAAFVAADSGCVYLISSGHSAADSYLYAVSPDGSNVFFETDDLLTPRDRSATPSIYDARVDGGEPPAAPPEPECGGETCQSAAPIFEALTPSSFTFTGPGNLSPRTQAQKAKGGKVEGAKRKPTLRQALKKCRDRFRSNRHRRHGCERHARRTFAAKSASHLHKTESTSPKNHNRNRGRGSR